MYTVDDTSRNETVLFPSSGGSVLHKLCIISTFVSQNGSKLNAEEVYNYCIANFQLFKDEQRERGADLPRERSL